MDSSYLEEIHDTLVKVARKAGEVVKRDFLKKKNFKEKTSTYDLITETDLEVEKIIMSILQEKYPKAKFIAEESKSNEKLTEDEEFFIIDPIDGTTNFVHQVPFVGISLAYVNSREVLVGVVYNPILDELYSAIKGKGAYLENISQASEKEKLRCSERTSFRNSLVLSCGITKPGHEKYYQILKKAECHGFRDTGSMALDLCWVARGIGDLFFEVDVLIPIWDVAAAYLIILESGGFVKDFNGKFENTRMEVFVGASKELVEEASTEFEKCFIE